MFKNKSETGLNNLCGAKIKMYRKAMPGKPSQKRFADMLQVEGLDLEKNSVQRIEDGSRFVTDIELKIIAKVLGVRYEDLLD